MKRHGLAFALLFVPLPAEAKPIELPQVYAGCPIAPNDPTRIELAETPKGAKLTYRRTGPDPGSFETLDVNLAKISRRLFFTLRTQHGLVEFQGRATDDALTGRLSDDNGEARTLSLAAVRNGALDRCVASPDSPP